MTLVITELRDDIPAGELLFFSSLNRQIILLFSKLQCGARYTLENVEMKEMFWRTYRESVKRMIDTHLGALECLSKHLIHSMDS